MQVTSLGVPLEGTVPALLLINDEELLLSASLNLGIFMTFLVSFFCDSVALSPFVHPLLSLFLLVFLVATHQNRANLLGRTLLPGLALLSH